LRLRSGRIAHAPLFLLILGCALGAFSLTFTHLAGSFGGPGVEDGTAAAARFKSSGAIAVDSSGNLYVADTGNHTIRVISSGEVTTLAGVAETAGSTEGHGAQALFNGPNGIYVNSSGTVYVADTGNHTIRKISSGYASTFAGSPGSFGWVDNNGMLARFKSPQGITGDPAGNLYVADTLNHSIRKITPSGEVTTLAGTGSPGNVNDIGWFASFSNPTGIVYDPVSGCLFVADTGNRVIRRITLPDPVVTTFAGTMGAAGHAEGAVGIGRMWAPRAISVTSSGSFYVADSSDSTIRSITSGGTLGTLAGLTFYPGPDDGVGSNGRFSFPTGIAVHSTTAYVADTGNHTIRKISLGDAGVSTFAGLASAPGFVNATGGDARFNSPTGLAFYPGPGGFAYVSDTGNHAIRRVGLDGVVTTLAGGVYGFQDGNGTAAKFRGPHGLALDFSTLSVYVADTENHCIRLVTASGDVSIFAGEGFLPGMVNGDRLVNAKFNLPQAVALNFPGTALYVADSGNRRVRRIDLGTGVVTTLAGSGAWGTADGNGAAASFGQLTGIVVDTSENVYVAESQTGTIRKIEPDGDVTTLAGSLSCCAPVDGTGTAARFGYPGPTSIAGGISDSAFIADPQGQLIRTIVLSSGVVGTAGGRASVTGTSDGTGLFARFNRPSNIASAGGEVVIAEGHKIRYGITELVDRATIDSAAGLAGSPRQLDALPETATSWEWSVIRRPAGSTATLSSTTIRNPTFTPDVADRYVFRCRATSAAGMSISTVTLNANGPATTLAVGYPGPFVAGVSFAFDTAALDAWGNVADGYTGTVHVTSSDSLATLPADYTFTPADHGRASLAVTLRTAGTQTITVTDTVTGTITGTGSFTVNAAATANLTVTMSSPVAPGAATSVTVTARDAFGNVAKSYLGTIHFSSSDGLAALPSNYVFTSGNQGVKTFPSSVTLQTSGTQSVTATDTGTASITGSVNVTVTPPTPLAFTATRSASQILLSWSAASGADHYEIYRAAAGTYVLLTTVTGTSHLDTTVAANTTYAYKVRAMSSGSPSPYSNADAATTLAFTDDPIVAGTTRIKASHITQLRTAVNSLRASAGLTAATFTDPVLSTATPIRQSHIEELRTALAAARSALGLTAVSFTDPTLVVGSTRVKAVHLTEIRSGVK
jgi:sugar lactone lactonase YvrE